MKVKTITKGNFQEEVMQSSVPVLLDFFANWCGPCRMLSPIVEEIGETAEGFKVGKINVDEEPELANAFSVSSIPMLAVIKDGKIVSKSVGVKPKQAILKMLI